MRNQKIWRAVRAAVAVGCLAWVAGLAAAQGVTNREIVLGQSLSLQDGKNEYAVAAAHGMQLYFDEVNARGGVFGRRIVTRVLDDGNNAAKVEENARKLVADGVFMLFSAIDGGPSTAVMKVANELKVPFFGPLAGPPNLRQPHQPYVFPVRAEHKDEFRALMVWGKNTGLTTVGFLHTDTPVGQRHLENVRAIAAELGLEVVLNLPFKPGTTDQQIDDWVKQIAAAKPAMFINHGAASLYGRLVARAKSAGVKTTFMGVNSGSSQIARSLGEQAQGMVFAQVVPSPFARKTEITREYRDAIEKSGSTMEISYGGLEGYATAKALVMTLQATGRDLTRERWLKTMQDITLDLGGMKAQYRNGNHEGSHFVDLSLVGRDGRFVQ